MLKCGSFFINNFEYTLASNDILPADNSERPGSLVDRPALVEDLYEHEVDF